MNKQLIGILVAVVALVIFVWRVASHPEYDTRSLAKIEYHLKCTECGAASVYTTEQLQRFVRKGQIVEVPMQVRRFPCSKCGKIAALCYPGVTDAQPPPP